MKKVLILCTGNSCRSQIAHGYLKAFASEGTEVYSAGVETHGVNPNAIRTMADDSLDISNHTSNHIDEYVDVPLDYVITVCDSARERCPYFPSTATLFHHTFPDPAKATGTQEEIDAEFDAVRDEIKAYCQSFASAYL